jgi:hypothetical protein
MAWGIEGVGNYGAPNVTDNEGVVRITGPDLG